MKLKNVILTGVTALSFGMIVGTSQASAKTYTTVPSSLRGNWYHYDAGFGYSKVHATKYHFNMKSPYDSWIRMYGNKFPSYAMGNSQMFVYKNSNGYYNISKYATDQWPYWKRVNHKGRVALKQLTFLGPGYATEYYYQTPKIAKHPSLRHSLNYYKDGFKKVTVLKDMKTTHYIHNNHGKLIYKKAGKTLKKGQTVYIYRSEGQWALWKGNNKYKSSTINYTFTNKTNSMNWFKDA